VSDKDLFKGELGDKAKRVLRLKYLKISKIKEAQNEFIEKQTF
jgi:hypothetical protein